MNRAVTNKINYFLDNWVPPRIRDSRFLMGIAIRMAFGPKYQYYMSFKDQVHNMREEEINQYYDFLSDAMIDRKTDLNNDCIRFILNHIAGKRILDAAAGRGYLAGLLSKKIGGGVY